MDNQTSIEIIKDTMAFKDTERKPILPLVGLFAGTIANTPLEKLLNDPVVQAESLLKVQEKYGYDGVLNCMDLTVEAEALGAEVVYERGSFPYVRGHPVSEIEQIDTLEINNLGQSRLSVFVDTTSLISEEIGETHLVSSYIIGPFTLAGHLMGVDRLLEMTIEDPDRVKYVIKRCEEIVRPYLVALIEAGAHNIVILEPSASNSIISPLFFEEYSAPYVKKMNDRIHKAGAKTTLHICGRTQRIISSMANTGADALSIDSAVELEPAMEEVYGTSTLIGNVDTTLLLDGSEKDVKEAVKDCLRNTEDFDGGFILSSGCDFPLETPEQNLRALVEVVLKRGTQNISYE